jgi:hypothetical protein
MSTSWRCTLLGHSWQPYLAGPDQFVEYCQRCTKEQTTTLVYAGPAAGVPRLVTSHHDGAQPATTR